MVRWLRFNVVGATGISVQLAVLGVLVHAAGAHYLLATAVAVEVSVLHNFIWHSRWTWADRTDKDAGLARRLARFHLTSAAVSLGANFVFMPVLVDSLGLDAVVANLATIAGCGLLNFALSDRFAFVS